MAREVSAGDGGGGVACHAEGRWRLRDEEQGHFSTRYPSRTIRDDLMRWRRSIIWIGCGAFVLAATALAYFMDPIFVSYHADRMRVHVDVIEKKAAAASSGFDDAIERYEYHRDRLVAYCALVHKVYILERLHKADDAEFWKKIDDRFPDSPYAEMSYPTDDSARRLSVWDSPDRISDWDRFVSEYGEPLDEEGEPIEVITN